MPSSDRHHALRLPWPRFIRRIVHHAALPLGVLLALLGCGTVGYHCLVPLGWLDAFLNASMILAGMGPVSPVETMAGKWFAAIYALLSGVVFLGSVGVVAAPIVHRLLHKFHLDQDAAAANGD